ncbi:MAG: helix-turn-helix transcriptional regulator [Brevibacillus sp.]|nr:helix-turn-helix transcriptional regulator [Brevibacillus sp.]
MKEHRWLEELRKQKRLTQAEIAKRSNIDRTYYTKIERGRIPSVRVAKRIAAVLGFEWVLFFESCCDHLSQDNQEETQTSTSRQIKERARCKKQ